MNALDTNALVRFLVRDDEQQATMVKQLLLKAEKGNEQLFVPLIVTLETMWVLSSAYDFSRNEILDAFEGLLALNVLLLEGYASIVTLCSKARTNNLDLADLLIGIIARENGCATTLTFDKRAAGSEYFTLIGGR